MRIWEGEGGRGREERAGRGGREGSERRKAKFRSMLNECGLGFLN